MRALLGWLHRRWFVRQTRDGMVGQGVRAINAHEAIDGAIAICIEDGNGRLLTLWMGPTQDYPIGIDLLSGYFHTVRVLSTGDLFLS